MLAHKLSACGNMEILATLIRRRLRIDTSTQGYCAVYEDQLQRIWPLNEENRKAKIAKFAEEYGFHLIFYKPGLCAIFEKRPKNKKSVGSR
jgi:hypothetical protein